MSDSDRSPPDGPVLASSARASGGNPQLFALLYDELHRLAERQLRRDGGMAGIGATTLLHEAWLGMEGRDDAQFPDRAHFLGYAARVMRGVVIDCARRATAGKRGGGARAVTLDGNVAAEAAGVRVEVLERLSDALDELAGFRPALAELVDLHFFCGYTHAEIAAMRGVSERTVLRDWKKARALLQRAVAGDEESGRA